MMSRQKLKRSGFLAMAAGVPLAACSRSGSLPPANNELAQGNHVYTLSPMEHVFPLPRPDGTTPSLKRVARSLRPHETTTTCEAITLDAFPGQHYYETYVQGTLVRQVYLSQYTGSVLPVKSVTKYSTVTRKVQTTQIKLPWTSNSGRYTLTQPSQGNFVTTNNSTGKIVATGTVQPNGLFIISPHPLPSPPTSGQAICAAASGFANSVLLIQYLDMMLAGGDVCVLAPSSCHALWEAVQEIVNDASDDFYKNWLKDFCAANGVPIVVGGGPNSCYSSCGTGTSCSTCGGGSCGCAL